MVIFKGALEYILRLKYLKRIKRNTEGKMEILIDPEQENGSFRIYKDVTIPARSPLSNLEWEKSVKFWPIVRPNCDSGRDFEILAVQKLYRSLFCIYTEYNIGTTIRRTS